MKYVRLSQRLRAPEQMNFPGNQKAAPSLWAASFLRGQLALQVPRRLPDTLAETLRAYL